MRKDLGPLTGIFPWRWIARLEVNGSNWDRTDYYYNESWQVLEERTETVDDEATVADAVKIQYVWDIRYIDAPVLRWRSVKWCLA